jgi:hypothetical protein
MVGVIQPGEIPSPEIPQPFSLGTHLAGSVAAMAPRMERHTMESARTQMPMGGFVARAAAPEGKSRRGRGAGVGGGTAAMGLVQGAAQGAGCGPVTRHMEQAHWQGPEVEDRS